jgi:hypothetical protein
MLICCKLHVSEMFPLLNVKIALVLVARKDISTFTFDQEEH